MSASVLAVAAADQYGKPQKSQSIEKMTLSNSESPEVTQINLQNFLA